jgi:DNA processing protein
MNSMLIQTILTLQQLRINSKEIDSLNPQDLPTADNFSLYENIKNNSMLPFNKRNEITSDSVKNAWDLSKEIMNYSLRGNVQIISKTDNKFPAPLRDLNDCPQLLHVKGNLNILNSDCLAIVGTRNPTQFGKEKAGKLSAELAEQGFTIVSGLAKGVDTAAHEGALKSRGHTVAVLAHGLQTIYPAENRDLASRILNQNGTLISEYPWNTSLLPRYLVERDRIQSGMSFGVMVIETGVKGGTMHTVKNCNKQNRLLMVLHHPKEYDTEENTLGNKEIISKFSGSNKFCLIDENDDGQKIIEKIRNSKVVLHGSAPFNTNGNSGIREISSGYTMQKSISGFARAVKVPNPESDGSDLNDVKNFQNSGKKKTEKIPSKAGRKPKKAEISDNQKTLL